MKTLLLSILILLATASNALAVDLVLTWNDTNAAPNNETQTLILRGVQGQTKAQVGTVNADVTTYTDTVTPSATTTYCYQVVAAIGLTNSQPSNEACKTIIIPNPPTGLSVK